MTECKLLFDFLENSNITDLSPSLQDHMHSCDRCKEIWTNYTQMLTYCNSFPNLEISSALCRRLVNIPAHVEKRRTRAMKKQAPRYAPIIAIAASILLVVTITFFVVTFKAPAIASHLPKDINKITHKAYSELLKAYNTRKLLIGNIQYMSLPISMKIRELLPGMVKTEQSMPQEMIRNQNQNVKKNNKEINKEEKQ